MTVRPLKRALLSVSDKSGLIEFARALHDAKVELVSTGGTSRAISEAGIPVKDVSELTGFPEMMDGRVKTLHPAVHGGLLALRDNPEHAAAMTAHGIGGIDLLVVNLYPFESTVASGADFDTCIENIDIGGPAMIRAGAKNWQHCAVVTEPEDYATVLAALPDGGLDDTARKTLAAKAYARTARYDAAISGWYAQALGETAPRSTAFAGTLRQTLRYGENPHQSAAFYVTGADSNGHVRPGVATATQLQGKELSYNNINDTDAAYEAVAEFDDPAIVIVKHANPCGVATGASLRDAYERAYNCDRVSAFGGIVACNRPLDGETAAQIAEIFTEVVIAPDADAAAREVFAAKKNLRLLTVDGLPDPTTAARTPKFVAGGFLLQDRDGGRISASDLTVATTRQPTADELRDLMFAWRVAKHVKSNAIVYAKDSATVGIGAGQMSRVDSTRIAARKAEDMAEAMGLPEPLTRGSVVASDAFFPFADGVLTAAEAGATALIQPGGSMRDDDVIAAANDLGLAMVFTGMRHFRH
jgi:phosphoribosylaminoimidazolecarboxamide formyltransferase/IMP cyclohydrolase